MPNRLILILNTIQDVLIYLILEFSHVFKERFKGILVERDNYLLALCRYIVLNQREPNSTGVVHCAFFTCY